MTLKEFVKNIKNPYKLQDMLKWIYCKLINIEKEVEQITQNPINQDNIHIVKYINNYPSSEQSILTIELNNLPTYTISEIQSLWFVVYKWNSEVEEVDSIPQLITTNLYKVINTGKGTYGVGGIQLTQDNLLFISSTGLNLEDIENNPLTQIYTINDLGGLTVSEYINQLNPAFLFQDVNIAPRLIKVIEPGNEADYLFLPPGGLYGQGELQTTIGDFQLLNQNQSGGLSSNTPRDLPEDFQIYCTYNKSVNNSNSMLYRTDTDRGFDISPYIVGQKVFTTNWVGRINNTLIVMGKINSDTGNLFILSLRDCKIINNVLIPQDFSFKFLSQVYRNTSDIPFALHSAVLHRGYCYFATRTQSNNTTVPTQLFKINPYDLDDVTIKELDITGPYNGSTGVMQAYKNNLYLMVSTTIGAGNRFIKIDENLENPEILFTVGNIDSTKRVPRDSVFVIYNDEVYIPYVNNLAGNPANDQIGMFVYDLFKRTLSREAMHVIDNASPTKPSPHWISEFGGKIIFHTANNINSNKHLISIDATTLSLEGNGKINLPDGGITNNNSITRDGYIYLNSEYSLNNGYLYKVKYNDIPATIDFNQADSPIGFYSLGSLERDVNEETVISKTSQLFNDGNGINPFITTDDLNSLTLQEVLDNGNTANISVIVENGSGGYSNLTGGSVGAFSGDGNYSKINAGAGLEMGLSGGKTALLVPNDLTVPGDIQIFKLPKITGTLLSNTDKGISNGITPLGADIKIPNQYLPALAITDVFPVASQAAMLALSTAETGDVAVRTDINKSFILINNTPGTLSNWQELLSPTDSVTSVDGQIGAVNLSTVYQAILGYTAANDANVIHKTGDEVKTGTLGVADATTSGHAITKGQVEARVPNPMVILTQAAYDALTPPDANTLYFIRP